MHTTAEEFENATITGHFGIVLEETELDQGSHMIIVTPSLSKSSVSKVFSVHTKTKIRRFSNFFGLKSVFETLCFRDGLVWTVGLIRRKKY